jgi:hypothetical protein
MNLSERTFAFQIPIQSFQGFNSPLQQIHFNENYLESERYPMARFRGKIIEQLDLSVPGTYEVRAKGIFELHGVTDERIVRGKLVVTDEYIIISASFSILLSDYDIRIPRIVAQKIAEEMEVNMEIMMK